MKLRDFFLVPILAAALPIATLSLTSCGDRDGRDGRVSSKPAVEAKYHYAVAMTGVV